MKQQSVGRHRGVIMRTPVKLAIVAVVMMVVGVYVMWGLTLSAIPDPASKADVSACLPDE